MLFTILLFSTAGHAQPTGTGSHVIPLGTDAGDDLTVGNNSALVVGGDNDSVGIGTSAPSGILDIEGGDVFIGTGTLTNSTASEDLSVTGNLEVDGSIYGDGSNLTGISTSSAYDDITAPDNNSTIAFAGFTNLWTTNEIASDFFNITNSGDFGDVSLMVLQSTGDPTDGTMFEIINTDTNVDSIIAPNFSLTQAGVLTATALDATDGNITNVGNVALDSISSDAGTTIAVTLGNDAGDDLLIDSTAFVVKGDSGNVGIGTSAPVRILHLSVAGSTPLKLERTGGNNANIEFTNTSTSLFAGIGDGDKFYIGTTNTTSGSSLFAVESGGNIGIGTTAPSGMLDVEGGDVFIGTATLTNTSANDDVSIEGNLEVDGTIYGDGSGITGISTSVSYDQIGDAAAEATIAFAGFTVDWTTNEAASDFFNITNSGDFGDVSLMVLQQTGNPTNGTMFEIINTDTDVDSLVVGGTDLIVTGAGNVGIGTSAPVGPLHVGVGGTFIVGSSGNVGIGTTAPGGIFEAVSGAFNYRIDSNRLELFRNSGTTTAGIRFTDGTIPGTNNGAVISFAQSGGLYKLYFGQKDGSGHVAIDMPNATDASLGIGSGSTVSQKIGAADVFAGKWLTVGNITQRTITGAQDYDDLVIKRDFDAASAQTSTGSLLQLWNDTSDGDVTDTTNYLEWGTDGAGNLGVIDTSGNLGIGENNPVALLHVGVGGTPTSVGVSDVYIRNDLEVDGTIYGDGSGITGVSASVTYDNIGDAAAEATIAFAGFTVDWTTNETASDFFNITNSGDFGDVSLMVLQSTGNPTDGTMFEIINTDTNVDSIIAPNFSLTQAGVLTATALDASDGNITNVGSVALDSISSDASTSITVTLGTDAGDDLIVGNNSALVVKGNNDRVGIGTSAPVGPLHIGVGGTVVVTNAARLGIGTSAPVGPFHVGIGGTILATSTGRLGVGTSAPVAPLHIGVGGTFIVDSTGNVGIGTSAPFAKLAVSGIAPSWGPIISMNDVGSNGSNTSFGGITMGSPNGDDFVWGKKTVNAIGYGQLRTTNGDLQIMTIDRNGNVGIGATVMTTLLHVGIGGTPGSTGSGDVYIRNDLEVDGTIYGDGSGITGVSVSVTYDNIGDAAAEATIAFAGFTVDWTTNETASDFFNITNSGDFGDVSLMVLQQTGNPTNGTMLEIINTDTNVDSLLVNTTDFVVIGGGNVGVGTSAPAYDLDVNGTANVVTSLEIPSGTGPTVDAEGEIAIDTTDDQLIYYGSAARVLSYTQTKCVTVEDLAAADDNFMFFSPPDNITLVSATCHCQGTCTTEADLSFETVQVGTGGPTVDDVGGTVDCEDLVAGDSATTLTADNTVDALDVIRFDVDNAVSPETDEYIICVNYSVDAQ